MPSMQDAPEVQMRYFGIPFLPFLCSSSALARARQAPPALDDVGSGRGRVEKTGFKNRARRFPIQVSVQKPSIRAVSEKLVCEKNICRRPKFGHRTSPGSPGGGGAFISETALFFEYMMPPGGRRERFSGGGRNRVCGCCLATGLHQTSQNQTELGLPSPQEKHAVGFAPV